MRHRRFALLPTGVALLTASVAWGWGFPPAAAQKELRDKLRQPAQGPAEANRELLWARLKAVKKRDVQTIKVAGLKVAVWRPAETTGRVPMVVFSHGHHGLSTQSTFLTGLLAENGYLVFAPTHKDAISNPSNFLPEAAFSEPDRWDEGTYRDRADDIRKLVDALHKEQPWAERIDWSRFGLAGYSLGGYTVLGLAGAWPSWKLPQVKAVLALSPYSNPFIKRHSLAALGMPVMYQGGTLDVAITPFLKRRGGAYDLTSSPAYFVEFEKAGHFAWTDFVVDNQVNIAYYGLAFLNKHLKGQPTADLARKLPGVAEVRSK